uniref:Uncharacterized protein n=1 Tax=Oryza glaberrima TaxID=4538 RepID=I1QX55_ORYGL
MGCYRIEFIATAPTHKNKTVSKHIVPLKPVAGPPASCGPPFLCYKAPKVVGFACSQQLALSVLDSLVFLVCWLLTWFLLFSSLAKASASFMFASHVSQLLCCFLLVVTSKRPTQQSLYFTFAEACLFHTGT